MKNIIIIIFTIGIIIPNLKGQDPHFSQYQHTPLWVNPALTGQMPEDVRILANYRNQWNTVTVPFQTVSVSYDMRIPKYFGKYCSYLAGGLFLLNDQAGDSEFRSTTAQLSLAYHQTLNGKKNPSYLSLGLMVGGGQMSINPDKLYFDNQYTGSGFDPNISSGENFDRNSFFYLDISAGLNFAIAIGEKSGFSLGVGMFHLNQPNVSFLGSENETLFSRIVLNGSGSISLGSDLPFSLLPSIVYMFQGPHNEFTIGTLFKWSTNEDLAILLGAYYRNSDALIPMLRFDYKMISLAFSFDMNTSNLNVASNSNGGMEVTLGFKPNIFNQKQVCPAIFCPL